MLNRCFLKKSFLHKHFLPFLSCILRLRLISWELFKDLRLSNKSRIFIIIYITIKCEFVKATEKIKCF